ncbi:carboxymuconolactone decarboxylase family protein [Promicromonospora panici]|uniref:carboxymuconolactone decarboxylase family protein n=1 Tax=Promicromonospora panici TaxID=2219658 RepID=UPI00101CDF9C|nr:carboxymuconolactone decarboxylase family protein [Promicromonospora panici]
MPNIQMPDFDRSSLPPALARFDEADALINVFKIMLRSPQIADAVGNLGGVQFAYSSLPAVDREMAILAAGNCYASAYEAAQHEPISRAVGVSEQQRTAIAESRWDSPSFSAAQATMIRFVVAVAEGPTVQRELLSAIRHHYTDQQVVELVVQTGYYFLIGRITTVFDVEIDAPQDARVLDAGVSTAMTERSGDRPPS